jgi:hypothetical protein
MIYQATKDTSNNQYKKIPILRIFCHFLCSEIFAGPKNQDNSILPRRLPVTHQLSTLLVP